MSGDPKNPTDDPEQESNGLDTVQDEVSTSTSLVVTNGNTTPTVVDEQVAELQEQLAEAKDEKNELIYYFILFLVILFDVFAFKYVGNVIAVLLIFFMECILLLGIASRLGVEGPTVYLASIIRAIESRIKKGD